MDQARVYARTSRERYTVSHLEFQLIYRRFTGNRDLAEIDRSLSVLDRALSERPQDIFTVGRKVLICLEALALTESEDGAPHMRYTKLGNLYFNQLLELGMIEPGQWF